MEVVGRDPGTDMAVLRLDTGDGLQARCVSVGRHRRHAYRRLGYRHREPLGFAGSVTVGIVSAKGRTLRLSQDTILEDLVQTDAVINPATAEARS